VRATLVSDILFIHPLRSSFVQRDIDILTERYSVKVFKYDKPRHLAPLLLDLMKCRLAFGWFALGYGYPMVKLGLARQRPSILVAGGYDVESIPQLKYGAMRDPTRRRRTTFALTHATRVLAVSRFTMGRVLHWSPLSRVEVLYHGFPLSSGVNASPRYDQVVTVANVSRANWRLKGLETLARVARRMPETSFEIVGRIDEDPRLYAEPVPTNVHFRGWVELPELFELYRTSKVYAQLSYVESFGCALAEAMSTGCLPVATSRGSLPEVVGDVGTLVPYGDVDLTEAAIREQLATKISSRAATRIQDQFPIGSRRRRLHALVDELLSRS